MLGYPIFRIRRNPTNGFKRRCRLFKFDIMIFSYSGEAKVWRNECDRPAGPSETHTQFDVQVTQNADLECSADLSLTPKQKALP